MLQGVLRGYNIRKYHRNVQRFFLFSIPYYSGMGLFFLLYNLYLLRLGYQEDFIGRLAGMMPLACGIVAIPIGILSDRFDRRPFLIAASLVLGLSQLGLCLTIDPSLLLLFAFLGGIAPSLVFVNHIPFLAENSLRQNRRQAVSVTVALQFVTRMAVSLVGGALPGLMSSLSGIPDERPEPFRYALFLGACCTLFGAIPLLGIRPRNPRQKGRAAATTEESRTARRVLAVFSLTSAFRGLAWGISFPFLNVFFQEELHASAAAIGAIFFLANGVGLPSAIMAPAASRRFGAVAAVVPLRVLGAMALGILGGMEGLLFAVFVLVVLSVAEGISTPIEMVFSTEVVSGAYWGRIQSIRVTGFQLFAAVGSIWGGEMIVRYGYGVTFGVGALATLLSGLLLLAGLGWHPERKVRAA